MPSSPSGFFVHSQPLKTVECFPAGTQKMPAVRPFIRKVLFAPRETKQVSPHPRSQLNQGHHPMRVRLDSASVDCIFKGNSLVHLGRKFCLRTLHCIESGQEQKAPTRIATCCKQGFFGYSHCTVYIIFVVSARLRRV